MLNALKSELNKAAKRILKSRKPTRIETLVEIHTTLIATYNNFTIEARKGYSEKSVEEQNEIKSLFKIVRERTIIAFASLQSWCKQLNRTSESEELVRLAKALNIPSLIGAIINPEEEPEIWSNTSTDISEDESDPETMDLAQLVAFMKAVIEPYDGKPEKLRSFLDQIEIIKGSVTEDNNNTMVAYVKAKLSGLARDYAQNATTLNDIQEALQKHIQTNDAKYFEKRLKNLKQQKDSGKYAEEIEDLANSLRRAHILDGLTVAQAEKLATNTLVESVAINASNNTTKLAMQVGNFASVKDVLEKVVNQPKESNENTVMFMRTNSRNNNNYNNRGRGRGGHNNRGQRGRGGGRGRRGQNYRGHNVRLTESEASTAAANPAGNESSPSHYHHADLGGSH